MTTIDWSSLGFKYSKTPYNVRCVCKNGVWGEIEVHTEDTIPMNIAASCLHYGQEAFEGLKAFRGPDGKIRLFRVDENAKRMNNSAERVRMHSFPEELFIEMVLKVVKLNSEFVPSYETGASLYIRPLLIGTAPQLGVHPGAETTLIIFVCPVGAYFAGMMKAMVGRRYDRAAEHGTGHVKVGGNYAASLTPAIEAEELGYDNVFYLNPSTKEFIDECGAANFFGIKNNTYVTPSSTSVLPSITNKSLCVLAEDMGLKVERRNIPVEELATFDEAGACGTAAVITPIGQIDDLDNDVSYVYGDAAGEWSTKLCKRLKDIQYGIEEDKYQWVTTIE
ncbi:MAG: branched-chain amino acid aminotransferase [Rikenellaceae bacterium]